MIMTIFEYGISHLKIAQVLRSTITQLTVAKVGPKPRPLVWNARFSVVFVSPMRPRQLIVLLLTL